MSDLNFSSRIIILPKLYSSFILFEPPRYSWNLLKVALNTITPLLFELINWIYFYTQKIFSNSKVWWNVILNLDIYDILKRNASQPQYRYYKKYSLFLLEKQNLNVIKKHRLRPYAWGRRTLVLMIIILFRNGE